MKNIMKSTILYLLFATSIMVAHNFDTDSIVTIETEDQLKDLLKNSQGPSAISFHMDRCGWCIKMHPIFETLANDSQFDHITFYSANGPILKAHVHATDILNEPITGYPTMFFMNQGKVIDKQIGGTTHEVMIDKLNALPKSTTPAVQKKSQPSKKAKTVAKNMTATAAQKKAKKSQAHKAVGAKIAHNKKASQTTSPAVAAA